MKILTMKNINIVSAYQELHFDDYPILFIGKNAVNAAVIGSFLYENDKNNTLMFFHALVQKPLLLDFIQRKISYLDVLKQAEAIYKVEKNYSYQIIHAEKVQFERINKAILPLPSAYCPIIGASIEWEQKTVAA
jgi:hypothetical protein